MTANATTNVGIYLGLGINPFPKMHCFATKANGANKTFLHSLNGVVKASKEEFDKKEKSLNEAKESFFSHFTA
jgi:hypothetical protein